MIYGIINSSDMLKDMRTYIDVSEVFALYADIGRHGLKPKVVFKMDYTEQIPRCKFLRSYSIKKLSKLLDK